MKLKVSCGGKTFEIDVDALVTESPAADAARSESVKDENTKAAPSTFGELKELISKEADLDPSAMKIIHRGRSLAGEDGDSLSNFKFKEGDKLLVLGKPPLTQEDQGWKQLLKYEKEYLPKIGKAYDKNEEDLAGLEQNFLEGPMRLEAIKKMERRLHQFTEDCLKLLETLDGLQIVSDQTHEEQAQRNREKRKSLVNGLQDLLNRNDKFVHRLKDYLYKVEHPEEAL